MLKLLEASRADQARCRDELDGALVAAVEKEQALAAKVGEGLEREKKLRDEWVRVKEELGRREEELRRATSRCVLLPSFPSSVRSLMLTDPCAQHQ